MRVYKVLSILFVLALAGCCKKMIPGKSVDRVVTDSVHTETKIIYHSDTVKIPGDTVTLKVPIPCPEFKLDTTIKKGRTELHLSAYKGTLTGECKTDSLDHIIDSLITEITTVKAYRKEVITMNIPYKIVEYKTPFWVWILCVAVALYLTGRITGKIRI